MSVFRTVQFLACTALLAGTVTSPAHESDDSTGALEESLVSWSAFDFAAHGPRPQKVRNLDVRYAEKDSGERVYMLCGQFLPGGEGNTSWTQFATIKTDPYEQWIGGQAESLCERALPLPASADDLSLALHNLLEGDPAPTIRP